MLWLDELIEYTETTASSRARIPQEGFAVVGGRMAATALIECIAQTAAAAAGYRRMAALSPDSRRDQSQAAGGVLAAVANFRIQAQPRAGQVLEISVREIKRFGSMLLIYGEISCSGVVIASGELTVHA
jgi:predicted hotdog family 3-hydroxylacyl-ACP dehydratase